MSARREFLNGMAFILAIAAAIVMVALFLDHVIGGIVGAYGATGLAIVIAGIACGIVVVCVLGGGD